MAFLPAEATRKHNRIHTTRGFLWNKYCLFLGLSSLFEFIFTLRSLLKPFIVASCDFFSNVSITTQLEWAAGYKKLHVAYLQLYCFGNNSWTTERLQSRRPTVAKTPHEMAVLCICGFWSKSSSLWIPLAVGTHAAKVSKAPLNLLLWFKSSLYVHNIGSCYVTV